MTDKELKDKVKFMISDIVTKYFYNKYKNIPDIYAGDICIYTSFVNGIFEKITNNDDEVYLPHYIRDKYFIKLLHFMNHINYDYVEIIDVDTNNLSVIANDSLQRVPLAKFKPNKYIDYSFIYSYLKIKKDFNLDDYENYND